MKDPLYFVPNAVLPMIASHILKRFCTVQGLQSKRITPDAMRVITAYPWPGNVRELENTLHRAALHRIIKKHWLSFKEDELSCGT